MKSADPGGHRGHPTLEAVLGRAWKLQDLLLMDFARDRAESDTLALNLTWNSPLAIFVFLGWEIPLVLDDSDR